MTRQQLAELIRTRSSYLCVGLDTDLTRIPKHLLQEEDPAFEFNKAIIDATREYCVSYKINTAFYEVQGARGWETMEKTVQYIGQDHFKIADAKRGDIGNTSTQYAKAFFETLAFDAITVTPYMGSDSIQPFLEYKGKWTIVLGITSNKGASDFELRTCGDQFLFEKVIRTVSGWGTPENLMFVAGATQSNIFTRLRQWIPDHFLLVPGVGAQGGNLEEITRKAINRDCGMLVNVSRDLLYASADETFAEAAGRRAAAYQREMRGYLEAH